VLDEETARSLVEAGSAVIHPLERGDLTAIHGVGGQRCTTGVCVASLSCWCEEAGAWVDFQLLAFVLAGKPPLRIIGNSFLRYHKAVIDVAGGRVAFELGAVIAQCDNATEKTSLNQ